MYHSFNHFVKICILVLSVNLVFINCNMTPAIERYKSLLNESRVELETGLEYMLEQNKIFGIQYWSNNKFTINKQKILFANCDYNEIEKNDKEIELLHAIDANLDNYQKIDVNWFFTSLNLKKKEFIDLIDFLKMYKIKGINIDPYSNSIRLVMDRGFVGESSGIIYVPINRNDTLEYYIKKYINPAEEYSYKLQQIGERWFYYTEGY